MSERCPTCGCPVTIVSTDDWTIYYEPALGKHVEWLESEIERLNGTITSLVADLDDERNVMPSEGVFLVEHHGSSKAYMRIAKLGEFPDPMRFAAIARHQDAIAAAIAEARAAERDGWIPSPMTEAKAVVRALVKAEGIG